MGYGINNLARSLGRIGYRRTFPATVLQLLRGLLRGEGQSAWKVYDEKVSPLRRNVFELREFRYFDPVLLLAR